MKRGVPRNMPDPSVLARALSGDPAAREAAVLDLCRYAATLVDRVAGGRWRCYRDDLYSHAYVAVCEVFPRLPPCGGPGRPRDWKSYLTSAVRNRVLDELGRMRRGASQGAGADVYELPAREPRELPCEGTVLAVRRAVDRLRPLHASVVRRRYGLGGSDPLRYRDLAEQDGRVRSVARYEAIHRTAVARLRSMLSHCA